MYRSARMIAVLGAETRHRIYRPYAELRCIFCARIRREKLASKIAGSKLDGAMLIGQRYWVCSDFGAIALTATPIAQAKARWHSRDTQQRYVDRCLPATAVLDLGESHAEATSSTNWPR